jgi:hypothetical protein
VFSFPTSERFNVDTNLTSLAVASPSVTVGAVRSVSLLVILLGIGMLAALCAVVVVVRLVQRRRGRVMGSRVRAVPHAGPPRSVGVRNLEHVTITVCVEPHRGDVTTTVENVRP